MPKNRGDDLDVLRVIDGDSGGGAIAKKMRIYSYSECVFGQPLDCL